MTVPTFTAGTALTAAQMNTIRDDVNPTAWVGVTFTNSWVNFGGAIQVCQYRKTGDVVQVRGAMKSGTMSAIAFTLPSGFRPPASIAFACYSNVAFGGFIIDNTGQLSPVAGSNVSFYVTCEFSVTA